MPGNIHSPTPKLKEGTFVLDPHFLESCHTPHPPGISHNHDQGSVEDPGEGPGGPTPPLLLDQNEARRAEKILFEPPPRPVISGSG